MHLVVFDKFVLFEELNQFYDVVKTINKSVVILNFVLIVSQLVFYLQYLLLGYFIYDLVKFYIDVWKIYEICTMLYIVFHWHFASTLTLLDYLVTFYRVFIHGIRTRPKFEALQYSIGEVLFMDWDDLDRLIVGCQNLKKIIFHVSELLVDISAFLKFPIVVNIYNLLTLYIWFRLISTYLSLINNLLFVSFHLLSFLLQLHVFKYCLVIKLMLHDGLFNQFLMTLFVYT